MPLGPALGQCCGGAVMLLTEAWDAAALRGAEAAAAGDGVFARPVAPGAGARPLAVRRAAALAASGGDPAPVLEAGWFAEAAARPTRDVWLWGAGHVGRALAEVLAPLPGLALSWVDTGPERFPEETPAGVTVLPAAHPPDLVAHAPRDAEHLIMTHSHALDLELCHRLLSRGFARCGLIGSATKRVRFRKRLEQLGHRPAAISRIDCPIGAPELGKHPQAIAVGVAGDLLRVGAAARDDRTEAAG
jgi:xanthine dehydrogenase accessory factor